MEHIYTSNMHCAACKGNIEKRLKSIKGILEVNANLVTNIIKVRFNEKIVNDETIIKACKEIGYRLEVIEDDEVIDNSKNIKKDVIKLISGLILLGILMFLSMSHMWPSLIIDSFKEPIYLLPILELVITLVIIGIFFSYYINGFKSLIKLSPNMDSLIFIGSLFSLIYSIYLIIKLIIFPNDYFIYGSHEENIGKIMFHNYLDSAAMILVIVSIGKFIEEMSKRKAKSTINELLKLRPKYANLVLNNEIKQIETKFLKSGDTIIIKEGETIPLDGIIVTGKTSVDESLLTGESLPVAKDEGDSVIGGAINKEGAITVLINKTKKDNVLSKIVSLVMEASNMDTKLTRKVDKVARVFVPIVIIISIIVFISWLIAGYINNGPILTNEFINIFDEAFTFAISVVVISCPCALGLATPISLLIGSSIFAKKGILVNNSNAIENIKNIDVIVLDKTNTITNGALTVTNYEIFNNETLKLNRIRTIEEYSTHPLSKGIVEALNNYNTLDKSFKMITNVPGEGVKGIYDDETIYIGNRQLFINNYDLLDKNEYLSKLDKCSEKGLLPIIAFSKNEVIALFNLKDELKPNAKEFINSMNSKFKDVILLTGDNEIIANNIANEVGIKHVISNVKPDEKGEVIKALKSEGKKVLMVGDGVNDSIALTYSDVGIGLAKGSDVALASSDFILMNSNLEDINEIIEISKLIRKNITFNLLWAFIYNVLFIPLAAGALALVGIMLNPMYASMLMALSSVTVCLNSLTLLIKKGNHLQNRKNNELYNL